MRRRFSLFAGALALLAVGASVMAALLGVQAGLPKVNFTNPSSLNHVVSGPTGTFTVATTPTSILFPGAASSTAFTGPAPSLALGLVVNTNGTVFGGVAGDDLVFRGKIQDPVTNVVYDGTGATPLLTGEIVAMGYLNGGIDLFDFRFRVTGGVLAPFYVGKDIGVSVQSDNGNTFVGVFTANFTGNAKGNLGPIEPLPGSCTASIGDFVWHDENQNGLQDVNEHGINGVSVSLNGPGGPKTTTTVTGPTGQQGYYQFTGLCAGTYTVTVGSPGGNYSPTTSAVGNNPAIDSNSSPATVTLATNTSTDQSIDFGFTTPCAAAIGDFVWNDANGNGIQESGEPGVLGVVVQLLDSNGNVIQSTTTVNHPTTGQPGFYRFDGLCGDVYGIHVVLPVPFDHFSPTGQGTPATDSDVNPATGTVSVSLGYDVVDLTMDIGLVPTGACSLGDFVWNDLNANGIQDAGEPGINGVLVTLSDSTGTLGTSSTTDHAGQHGYYQFTGLSCNDTYLVSVTRPSSFTLFSPTGQGTLATDSNGTPSQDHALSLAQVTLSPGNLSQTDQTIDFGFYACSGMLGDFVWNDLNGNGIQDVGEPGLPDVTLQLLDSHGVPIVTTMTLEENPLTLALEAGRYEFTGLCLGTYTVKVLSGVPGTLEPTGVNAPGSTPANDNNGSPTSVTLFTDVSSDLSLDFGFKPIPPATLGDRVWHDTNANGTQDGGEPGIDGVLVELLDSTGASVLQTTTTAGGGAYSFTVAPGTYTVRFSTPAGYTPTVANNGADATDSDADALSGVTGTYTLGPNGVDLTVDAGFYQLAKIGDFVWVDANANGQQDGGELGLAGVTVDLYACGGGSSLYSMVTGADGSYMFSGLTPGCYFVKFAAPGYLASPANVGSDVTDSDAVGGVTGNYTLNSGDSNLTVDAGFYQLASLAGYVYVDANNDGVKQGTEAPIAGVTVALTGTDVNGAVVNLTTTTDGTGLWSFANLMPGTYVVTETQPAAYLDGKDTIGTPGGTTGNDVFSNVVLASGVNGVNNNFGELQPASLAGYVYVDANNDGVKQGTEAPIAGVTVKLTGTDVNGAVVNLTTTTDGTGLWSFTNLMPGTYVVTETQPAAYLDGKDTIGTPGGITGNDVFSNVVLTSGVNGVNNNFGELQPASIAGFVYVDANDDGVKQPSETPIAGVTVTLGGIDVNGAPVSLTTTTNASGLYIFTNLVPGIYVVTETQPAAYLDGKDTIGTLAGTVGNDVFSAIALPSGVDDVDNNLGELTPARIGDRVWLDRNGNGQQDAGELGIAGVTVKLLDSTGATLRTTITDASGIYGFANLTPGSYAVQFVAPAGAYDTFTTVDTGADGTDSDANTITGKTGIYTVASGDTNLTIDAGLLPIDLSVTKTVNSAAPAVGTNVVFTVTVSNASGLSTATGVTVADTLPAGLTYVSSMASQGSYSGGLWTVGTLASPATATLTITATATSVGAKTNYAQVKTADQVDRDSTPNNNPGPTPSEDDEAKAVVTPVTALTASCVAATTGLVGSAYSSAIVVSGGTSPYTFALASGSLPGGLTLNPSTGVISGMPTTGGAFPFTVKVTDATPGTPLTFTTPGCGITIGATLACGDTATIGYWHNNNGQALIKALNGGSAATNLATWLASNYPYFYGANAGANNLTGRTNADVAAKFQVFFDLTGPRTDAQVMAVALAVYVTDSDFAGAAGVSQGFKVSTAGTGAKVYNVGTTGAAIGLSNNTTYSVLTLLQQANLRKQQGTFDAVAFNAIFDGINTSGDIGKCVAVCVVKAVADYYSTNKDHSITILANGGILSNDSKPIADTLVVGEVNGSALKVGVSTATTHGMVKVNADGSFSYTPAAGYSGTDTFTYKAKDGATLTNLVTVTITIAAHYDGDGCDHDRHRYGHVDGDHCAHDKGLDRHYNGDGDDHDLKRNGHRDGDGCAHERDTKRHYAGDGCDHDRRRNGHRDGDDCEHDKNARDHYDADGCDHDRRANGHRDGDGCEHDRETRHHNKGDGDEHDKGTPGHSDGDGCDHEREVHQHFAGDGCDHDRKRNGHGDGDGCEHDQESHDPGTGNPGDACTVGGGVPGPGPTCLLKAVSDNYTTNKDHQLPILAAGILANDSRPTGSTLVVGEVNGNSASVGVTIATAHGTVKVNADGSLTFSPAAGFTGTDSFTYRAKTGTTLSNLATVTITIMAHYDGDGCDHDRRRYGHVDGDHCAHDKALSRHFSGDGCDHDLRRNGHASGDGCAHDRDTKRHYKGDGDSHDRGSYGHYNGDGCEHDRTARAHYDGDGDNHDRGAYGHKDGDGCAHDLETRHHNTGDGDDHDKGINGHKDGDGCEHDREGSRHSSGDGDDHDRRLNGHYDGDGCEHDQAMHQPDTPDDDVCLGVAADTGGDSDDDHHFPGDGDDHDQHKNGHYEGDGCTHEHVARHYKGDGDDHDKGRNGHYKGDGCEHEKSKRRHR